MIVDILMQRSIRVEGKVGRVPEQESNDYFHSRFHSNWRTTTRPKLLLSGRSPARLVPVCQNRAPSSLAERF